MQLPETLERHLTEQEATLPDLLCEFLAHDTSNPPGKTATMMEDIESRLTAWGLESRRVTVDPAKPNLLARLPGESERTLLFNGHLDTVPYDADAWEHDPLGERDGDRIYGRGATDMKGSLAAMLLVAGAFAETRVTPPVDLVFAFVSDEEVAGDAGLPAVLKADALEADGCVIGETTCAGGRHSVTVADRGSIWLTLRATGAGAHGSRPMLGVNAIDRLYRAVERVREEFGREHLAVPPELDPVIEESVEYYAPTLDPDVTRDLFAHPSINLGTIEGGESINSVPQSAQARLDIRLTAGVETPDLLRRVRACVDSCDGVTVAEANWSVGTYEPIDSPLVEAVAAAAGVVSDRRIYRRSATGGGDAKKLRHHGVPTVEFGFGTETAHADDEFTTVRALRWNARTYARIPYCFAEELERE